MDYAPVRALYLTNILPFDLPHTFISKLGMIDFRIQIIAHNGSTPSHFFFYDLLYLKCLPVSAEKVPRGPNERALKGLQLKLRQYLKDSKDLLDEFPYE